MDVPVYCVLLTSAHSAHALLSAIISPLVHACTLGIWEMEMGYMKGLESVTPTLHRVFTDDSICHALNQHMPELSLQSQTLKAMYGEGVNDCLPLHVDTVGIRDSMNVYLLRCACGAHVHSNACACSHCWLLGESRQISILMPSKLYASARATHTWCVDCGCLLLRFQSIAKVACSLQSML